MIPRSDSSASWRAEAQAEVERRKPHRGRRRGHSSEEGVLVPAKPSSLTRSAAEREPGDRRRGTDREVGPERGGRDRGRQKHRFVLDAAENAAIGKRRAKGLSIGAPHQVARRSNRTLERGLGLGKAPRRVEARRKLEARRQAKLHPVVRRSNGRAQAPKGGGRASASRRATGSKDAAAGRRARSGIGQQAGARFEIRLQKSGRRIFLAGRWAQGDLLPTRKGPNGEMARGDPPSF